MKISTYKKFPLCKRYANCTTMGYYGVLAGNITVHYNRNIITCFINRFTQQGFTVVLNQLHKYTLILYTIVHDLIILRIHMYVRRHIGLNYSFLNTNHFNGGACLLHGDEQ